MNDWHVLDLDTDPVPGDPDQIRALAGRLRGEAELADHNTDRLRGLAANDNALRMEGDYAPKFRQVLKELPDELAKLGRAYRDCGNAVSTFASTLEGAQAKAGVALRQGRDAEDRYQGALSEIRSVLPADRQGALGGGRGLDTNALEAATVNLDEGLKAQVRAAARRARFAEDDKARARRLAQEAIQLRGDAETRCVNAIHAALHGSGIKNKEWWQKASDIPSVVGGVGDWVHDHLDVIHSVLSTISAVAGLIALVTPPPIDVIALGVAVVAGAGAFAIDLAKPEFRHQMARLATGHFDKASLGAAMTGAADGLSVVPGVSVAAKVIKGGKVASEFPKIVEIGSAVAKNPGIPAKLISRIPGAGKALETTRLIDQGAGASTMVTQNMINILWRGKGVATNLYHDAEQAVA